MTILLIRLGSAFKGISLRLESPDPGEIDHSEDLPTTAPPGRMLIQTLREKSFPLEGLGLIHDQTLEMSGFDHSRDEWYSNQRTYASRDSRESRIFCNARAASPVAWNFLGLGLPRLLLCVSTLTQ